MKVKVQVKESQMNMFVLTQTWIHSDPEGAKALKG